MSVIEKSNRIEGEIKLLNQVLGLVGNNFIFEYEGSQFSITKQGDWFILLRDDVECCRDNYVDFFLIAACARVSSFIDILYDFRHDYFNKMSSGLSKMTGDFNSSVRTVCED